MSANPHCTLPDYVIDPLSDELEAIENLAGRLRKHAAADAFADHPDTLGQLDLLACSIGIVRISEGLGRYMESLRTTPETESLEPEITFPIDSADYRALEAVADRGHRGDTAEDVAARIIRDWVKKAAKGNEITLELTQVEAIGLKCLADSWGMDMESAASRVVMEELQRRFRLPEEPKKAA